MHSSKSGYVVRGLAALMLLASVSARAELVVNGGFETGTFSGWTQFGDASFSGVDTFAPQSGTFAAFFGPSTPGGIFESLTTVAGQSYTVGFWLMNENDPFGAATPNSFAFNWNGGATEMVLTNAPATAYTHYTFNLLATSSTTDLRFTFTDTPAFWDLDNVSVNAAVPEPGSLALLGLGGAILGLTRRRQRS